MNALSAQGRAFVFVIPFDPSQGLVATLDSAGRQGIHFDFRGVANTPPAMAGGTSFSFRVSPPSRERYREAFRIVQAAQQRGESYLLNLTLPSAIDTDLTMFDIFRRGRAPYRLLVEDCFTVFSPETFVRIDASGTIRSFPMKGTIAADTPQAAELILANTKEAAEQVTITDLIRNDLSRVAQAVRVERYRYLESVPTHRGALLQVCSEIVGRLPEGWQASLGDIFHRLLPAGSVTGAPKPRTLELIAEAEGYDRTWYTGIAGIFDGRTVDSTVLIRYIERTPRGLVFKSGGGITVYSDPDVEYAELVNKVYVPFA